MLKEKIWLAGSKLVFCIRIAIKAAFGLALLSLSIFLAWSSAWFFYRLAGWLHKVIFGQPW